MRFTSCSFSTLVGAFALASSCALPAPPDGGPRDQDGPKVLKSSVAMGATSVHVQELEWTFDEYVVLNNPAANLRVSPPLPTVPDVRLTGKTLKINWAGDLSPDRTYMIQFGNAVRDLHEGNPMSEPFWVFSTGAAIDSGVVAGMLLDPWTGKPHDGKAVVLYSADAADSAMYRDPVYGTRSTKEGRFTLPYLAHGRYQIMAFDDPDGNLKLGTGEKSLIAWRSEAVSPGDTAVTLWLGAAGAKPDSAFAYRKLPVDSAGVLKLSVAAAADGPWVHQLRRDGIVLWQDTGDRTWTLEGLKPGKYSLRSFVDLNKNGQLDAGDWWTRTVAERPLDDPEAVDITVGWTVERLWRPGASPSVQTDLGPQGTGSASAPPQGGSDPTPR
jgi:Bacterial Ig-like domain